MMRKILLELWFMIYAVVLLPSWFCALIMNYVQYPKFIWISPMMYARYSRSVLNALISIILWLVIITAWEHLHA